jgi:hypothetical protein
MPGAVEVHGDTVPLVAAVDLSAYQYRFVICDGDGKAALIVTEGDLPLGILQNKPKAGEVAQIKVLGGSKLYVSDDGTINAGTLLMADGTDKGDAKTATGAGKVARAIALEDGVQDTFMSVLLSGPTVMHS